MLLFVIAASIDSLRLPAQIRTSPYDECHAIYARIDPMRSKLRWVMLCIRYAVACLLILWHCLHFSGPKNGMMRTVRKDANIVCEKHWNQKFPKLLAELRSSMENKKGEDRRRWFLKMSWIGGRNISLLNSSINYSIAIAPSRGFCEGKHWEKYLLKWR